METIIIGISGKMRSGKDSAAKAIQEIIPNSRVWHWADLVKESAAAAMGLPLDHFKDDTNKIKMYQVGPKETMTGRELLQRVGTECFRNNVNKDFWVTRLMSQIKQDHKTKLHIIPDTRFPNEAEVIKLHGGYVIKIDRDDLPESDHLSETALDGYKFDCVIDNNNGYMAPEFMWQVNDFLININAF